MKIILLIVVLLQTLSLFQYVESILTTRVVYEYYECYQSGGKYDRLNGYGKKSEGRPGRPHRPEDDDDDDDDEGRPLWQQGSPGPTGTPRAPGKPGSQVVTGKPGHPRKPGKPARPGGPDPNESDDDYDNDGPSPIKTITRYDSTEVDETCTVFRCSALDKTFNLTDKNNQVMSVTFKMLDTSASRIHGNSLLTQHGLVMGGICDGSYIYISNPCFDPKESSCFTNAGLKRIDCPHSYIIFKGESCNLFCPGTATAYFTPGIKEGV